MELEEQVTLTCEASGDPIPSITWRTSTRNISSEEKVQCHPRVSGLWNADLKHLKSTPGPVLFGTWQDGMWSPVATVGPATSLLQPAWLWSTQHPLTVGWTLSLYGLPGACW